MPTFRPLLGPPPSAYGSVAVNSFPGRQSSQPPPSQIAPVPPPWAFQNPPAAPVVPPWAPWNPPAAPGPWNSSNAPSDDYFEHVHSYYGRTVRVGNRAPAMGNQPPQPSVPGGNCDFCSQRPKYFDGIRLQPFCSPACAEDADNYHRELSRRSSTMTENPTWTAPPWARQAPNYQNTVYTNANDSLERIYPPSEADPESEASWRHSPYCPPVRRVDDRYTPPSSLDAYEAYKRNTESRRHFVNYRRTTEECTVMYEDAY